MKTKKRNESVLTVNLVGLDPVLCERIRASLGRSPFHFTLTNEPMPDDEADLFVLTAADLGDLARRGVPVIACGTAALLRGAFLAGCDDYLREPWTPDELATRAQAVLSRRTPVGELPWGQARLVDGELQTPHGRAALTHHETVILRALLRQRGRPAPRAALACLLGGGGEEGSRSIDMHVSALRRRLRALIPESGPFIVCVRGQGYMIP